MLSLSRIIYRHLDSKHRHSNTERNNVSYYSPIFSTPTMSDTDNLGKISVVNLTKICRHHIQLSRLDCRTRASLYSAILGQPTTVQEIIVAEVNGVIKNGSVKYGRKSKESVNEQPSKRRRLNSDIAEEIVVANGERHFTHKRRKNLTKHPKGNHRLQPATNPWPTSLQQQDHWQTT